MIVDTSQLEMESIGGDLASELSWHAFIHTMLAAAGPIFTNATFAGTTRLQGGTTAAIIGADSGANTLTNLTDKVSRVAFPHYNNAEEPVAVYTALSNVSESLIVFGGGTSLFNSPRIIAFNTAANTTTTVGTEVFRINQNQRMLIGTTSDDGANKVQIVGSLTQGLKVTGRGTFQNGQIGLLVGADGNGVALTDSVTKNGSVMVPHYLLAEEPVTAFLVGSFSTSSALTLGGGSAVGNAVTAIDFYTAPNNTTLTGTIRMRIDTLGQVGIGNATVAGMSLYINKTITGAAASRAIFINAAVQSDVTTSAIYCQASLATQATAFTITDLIGFNANVNSLGAGSIVTRLTGFLASNTLIGGADNYGFRGQIAAAATNWNAYMDGTAKNYFAGVTIVGAVNTDDNVGHMIVNSTGNSRALSLRTSVAASDIGVGFGNPNRAWSIFCGGTQADALIIRDLTAPRNVVTFATNGNVVFFGNIGAGTAGVFQVNSLQVVSARKTGWATATGTATRTAFDTATVTLPQLAERVKALIDDLHSTAGHGLIGT